MDLKEVKRLLRETQAEMKAAGVRRISCFNGGHSPESYRLNSEMYRLESLKKELEGGGHAKAD